MWVKKTETEFLEDEKRRLSAEKRNALIFWALFDLAFFLPKHRYGNQTSLKYLYQSPPLRQIIFRYTLGFFVWTLLCGVGVYYSYWLPRRNKTLPKTLICPSCEKAKNPDGNYECACGGKYVDIETMKWVRHAKK